MSAVTIFHMGEMREFGKASEQAGFDEAKFLAGFDGRFTAWYAYLSPGKVEDAGAKEKAREDLVSYCAEAIAAAEGSETKNKIVDLLQEELTNRFHKGEFRIGMDVIFDVFKDTIWLSRKK